MRRVLRNFLKRHFLILKVRDRLSPQTQIAQRALYLTHRQRIRHGEHVPLAETGYRVFSQFEEDGLLLYIFAVIGMGRKTFVDIGSDDGINSNCANLSFHFGWHGLFIDANRESIRRGRQFYRKYPHEWTFKPLFRQALVTPENVNEIISESGISGDIELLSIDIDGNDYWVWNAIEIIRPRVVIIETHVMFGLRDIVVPYQVTPDDHPLYHGASPVAMVKLGSRKGYRLVGANQLGFNFIFVRKGVGEAGLPAVSVESVLQHQAVQNSYQEFAQISHREFVTPIV